MARVLVVDESWVSQGAYQAALRHYGHDVEGCDVRSSRVGTEDLGLVLVNLADPTGDKTTDDFPGLAIAERLRRTAPNARIVAYTSFADHLGVRYRSRCLGVDGLFSRSDLEDGSLDEFYRLVSDANETGTARLQQCVDLNAALGERGLASECEAETLVEDARALLNEQAKIQGLKSATARRSDLAAKHGLRTVLKRGIQDGATAPAPRWSQIHALWEFLTQV